MKYAVDELTNCPLTADELQETVALLESMPSWLESALAELSDEKLRLKPAPAPEAFSLVEHVLHLRDIEVEGYSRRMRRLLSEPNPLLEDIDGTALAVQRSYNRQPVGPALAEFSAARRQNVARLKSLTEEDLARSGEMEFVGTVTLSRLIRLWRQHDTEHRAEIQALVGRLRDPESEG